MEKFIKFMRSEKTSALLETDPVAFHLLSLIAYRARRTHCIIRDLDIGEALIGVGDFTSVNFTAGQYRESLKRLTKYELITTRTTNKGTIAKLVSDSVYDINQDTSQQANNKQKLDTDQVATKARPNSDQDDTKTPIHNNPTTSKTIPANTINNSVSGVDKNDQQQANNNPTTSELQANYKRTTTQLQLTKNERMKERKNERMEEEIQVETSVSPLPTLQEKQIEPIQNLAVTSPPTTSLQPKKYYSPATVQYQLAHRFVQSIRDNIDPQFKIPNMQKWADEIDKMIRIDGRREDQVAYMIGFVHKHDFWAKNILSPKKMREKFTTLVGEIKSKHAEEKKQEVPKRSKYSLTISR